MKTIYKFKNDTSTTYYYQCNKSPKCKGTGKFDLKEKKFYITNKCDSTIPHIQTSPAIISFLMDNNQLDEINFSLKKLKDTLSNIYSKNIKKKIT